MRLREPSAHGPTLLLPMVRYSQLPFRIALESLSAGRGTLSKERDSGRLTSAIFSPPVPRSVTNAARLLAWRLGYIHIQYCIFW